MRSHRQSGVSGPGRGFWRGAGTSGDLWGFAFGWDVERMSRSFCGVDGGVVVCILGLCRFAADCVGQGCGLPARNRLSGIGTVLAGSAAFLGAVPTVRGRLRS